MDPDFTWAINELGDAYLEEAKQALVRGQEAVPQLESALHQYERALELDPRFSLPMGGLLEAATLRLEADIARGREAPEALQTLSLAVSQLEQSGSHPWVVALWKARAHRLRARHDFVQGRDPRASLDAAFEAIRGRWGAPEDSWLLEELVQCRLLEAEAAQREGREASPALERAGRGAQGGRAGGARRPLQAARRRGWSSRRCVRRCAGGRVRRRPSPRRSRCCGR